jgi:hypothetical protein
MGINQTAAILAARAVRWAELKRRRLSLTGATIVLCSLCLLLPPASPAGAAVGKQACGPWATYEYKHVKYYACIRHWASGMTADTTVTNYGSSTVTVTVYVHIYITYRQAGYVACRVTLGPGRSAAVVYSPDCRTRAYVRPANTVYAAKGHVYGDNGDSLTANITP